MSGVNSLPHSVGIVSIIIRGALRGASKINALSERDIYALWGCWYRVLQAHMKNLLLFGRFCGKALRCNGESSDYVFNIFVAFREYCN